MLFIPPFCVMDACRIIFPLFVILSNRALCFKCSAGRGEENRRVLEAIDSPWTARYTVFTPKWINRSFAYAQKTAVSSVADDKDLF